MNCHGSVFFTGCDYYETVLRKVRINIGKEKACCILEHIAEYVARDDHDWYYTDSGTFEIVVTDDKGDKYGMIGCTVGRALFRNTVNIGMTYIRNPFVIQHS